MYKYVAISLIPTYSSSSKHSREENLRNVPILEFQEFGDSVKIATQ